jgi:hypothetical protein
MVDNHKGPEKGIIEEKSENLNYTIIVLVEANRSSAWVVRATCCEGMFLNID